MDFQVITSAILPHLYSIILLVISAMGVRFILEFFDQSWIKTYSQTITISILPVITYVITNVISGNIALSLGMVGALSIVRFRNPVKSPLELAVYFAVITMGISASVDLRWLVFFDFAIIFVLVSIYFVSKIYKFFLKDDFFKVSFSEGNIIYTIELKAKKNLNFLDNNENILNISKNNDSIIYYIGSKSKENILDIFETIKKDENIISYQLNF